MVSLEENSKIYLEKHWQEAYESLNKVEKAQSNETKYLELSLHSYKCNTTDVGGTDAENSILYFLEEKEQYTYNDTGTL